MKKLLIIIIFLLPLIVFAQSGGQRSLKTKSENIIHTDFISTSDTILIYLVNGVEKQLYLDPKTIYIENDTLKSYGTGTGGTGWNYSTQTLSGTSVSWNINNGLNAVINTTGATTITFSNLEDGMNGTLYNLSGSNTYYITFSGYTAFISSAIYRSSGSVYVSASGKKDVFSWKYINGIVIITGTLELF